MSIDFILIGNAIRKRRKELGITQKDIAENLNISLENGKIRNPTIESLDKIAEFLGGVHNKESKKTVLNEVEMEPKDPDIRRIARARVTNFLRNKQKLYEELRSHFFRRLLKMNKIPSKPRYERTLKLALEFILKEGINSLPIDPIKILEKYVVSISTVGEISKKLSIPRKKVISGKEADVFFYRGLYKVVYNEYIASSARIRWTLIHELGHIYLGHLTDFEQANVSNGNLVDSEYQVLEREANFFASEILAPKIVLKHLGIHYWEFLKRLLKSKLKSLIAILTQIFIVSLKQIF